MEKMPSTMNRRKSIGMIAAGCSPFLLYPSNFITVNSRANEEWMKNFTFRWNNSETYCFNVFNALPISDFSFKPTPEVMSFGKLFSHIGNGLNIYAGVLVGTTVPNEPELASKSEISEYLELAFQNFNNALNDTNLDNLYAIKHAKSEEQPWKDFSVFDIITLGYNHTVHHIAQATVYLRLRNIVPPKYRF